MNQYPLPELDLSNLLAATRSALENSSCRYSDESLSPDIQIMLWESHPVVT